LPATQARVTVVVVTPLAFVVVEVSLTRSELDGVDVIAQVTGSPLNGTSADSSVGTKVSPLTFAATLVVDLFQVLQRFFQFNQVISGGTAAVVRCPFAEPLRCRIHRFFFADAVTKGRYGIAVFAFIRYSAHNPLLRMPTA
jgi:hypothetical protein